VEMQESLNRKLEKKCTNEQRALRSNTGHQKRKKLVIGQKGKCPIVSM